jgi:hypothetical protein
MIMPDNEFSRPISADLVPVGSLCEWCGKPAEKQLTAIGGTYHNESGLFCHSCGEEFLQGVVKSLHSQKATTPSSEH